MRVNNYQHPTYSYENDSSYNSPPAPGAPGPFNTQQAPGSNAGSTPTSPYNSYPAGTPQKKSIPARDQTQVPDAILNMASKGSPDKKPWAYAPDMNSIQQQRERVRRRWVNDSDVLYRNLLFNKLIVVYLHLMIIIVLSELWIPCICLYL